MAERQNDNRTEHNTIPAVIDGTREMNLHDDVNVRKNSNEFEDVERYENVFSWKMRNVSSVEGDVVEFKTLDKFQAMLEKQETLVTYEDGLEQFNLRKFNYQLLLIYELYYCKKFDDSLKQIENFVENMECVAFDKSNEQYVDAYKHILYSSYAFIATSMNLNILEEIMKNVKPKTHLTTIEKSAIHAVKALVFMKYPSKSKQIAFDEADLARSLNPIDCEWIHIWMRTKGILGRQYNNFSKPDYDQLKAAEYLLENSQQFWHLRNACSVFIKVIKCNCNKMEKEKYFTLSSNAILKALELAECNEILIFSCLTLIIDQPILIIKESIIFEKIKILQDSKNPKVHGILGSYYLRHRKDYDKAEEYFTYGKEELNDFYCIINLVKIKCIKCKEPDNFPFIDMLMEYNEVFANDIRRVKIYSQILLYCVYYDKDQDKLMDFLKLFMDQPFDSAFKYRHLISVIPIFKMRVFDRRQFINHLLYKAENMVKYCEWSSEEKRTFNDTLQKFSEMVNEGKQNVQTVWWEKSNADLNKPMNRQRQW